MSERDEIEKIILETYQTDFGVPVTGTFKDCADAVLAAGYRKPRTITTMEELNALPVGSVFRDPDGSVGELADGYTGDVPRVILWCGIDHPDTPDPSLNLPATVLYTPEEA